MIEIVIGAVGAALCGVLGFLLGYSRGEGHGWEEGFRTGHGSWPPVHAPHPQSVEALREDTQ